MSGREFGNREASLVAETVAVLEQAHGAVDAALLPALTHPALRPAIDLALYRVGRVVITHEDRDSTPLAFASGYADDVAVRLAADGFGLLSADDRAVLALVLLRTVALPTAQGRPPARWSQATPVSMDRLHDNRCLTKNQVKQAVKRLTTAGVLHNGRAVGVRPGPAFDRLTVAQRQHLAEQLFIVAAPGDPVAEDLVARHRANRADSES